MRRRWLARHQKRAAGTCRLLFAHAVEGGVGLDGGRVDGLPLASHQLPGHARGKNVVKQALEHGGREELACAAHGRVPGPFLVHFVAQKQEAVEPQGAVLDQAPVADQVFQAADEHELEEHELEEHDRVERGLARVAVKRPGLVVEKRPVHQLGEPTVQVMGRDPLGEPKARHLLVEKHLLALHLPATKPGSATATRVLFRNPADSCSATRAQSDVPVYGLIVKAGERCSFTTVRTSSRSVLRKSTFK